MRKIFLVLLLFLILGGLFYYKNFASKNISTGVLQPLSADQQVIYVSDQRPGQSVNISFASLNKSSYIVIRSNNNGELGSVLGNSKILPAGEARKVTVGLIRPSLNGEILFAVIYEDSGDGVFSPGVDVPAKDENGNIIFMMFNVDQGASGVPEIKI